MEKKIRRKIARECYRIILPYPDEFQFGLRRYVYSQDVWSVLSIPVDRSPKIHSSVIAPILRDQLGVIQEGVKDPCIKKRTAESSKPFIPYPSPYFASRA